MSSSNRRSEPRRRRIDSYPFVHELRSQFRDMDVLGHVNNVVIGAWFEDARAHFLRHHLGGGNPDHRSRHRVVANVEIDYLDEVLHPRAYRIGAGVLRVGTTSVTVSLALFAAGVGLGDGGGEMCHALCDATLVTVEGHTPVPVSDAERETLTALRTPFSS
ncbi:acyl-CoA thioesterase [Spongisporangium articulatum]|uniref:Acyl-CoA thioesterase n=1 Tax=Spongisporangium articulatum TaxID=3362603 RepID=A0ABW8AKV6_9ACTN